jgi:hypothetical protein
MFYSKFPAKVTCPFKLFSHDFGGIIEGVLD